MLRKIEKFQIEDAPECAYDYVEVRDGGDESSTSLIKECGKKVPNTIQSTGNKMFVRFYSDSSDVGKGFSASFKTTTQGPTTQGPTAQPPPNGCGSPQYANDRWCDDDNNNDGCNWDDGACCGDNVDKEYCTLCECRDPNAGA